MPSITSTSFFPSFFRLISHIPYARSQKLKRGNPDLFSFQHILQLAVKQVDIHSFQAFKVIIAIFHPWDFLLSRQNSYPRRSDGGVHAVYTQLYGQTGGKKLFFPEEEGPAISTNLILRPWMRSGRRSPRSSFPAKPPGPETISLTSPRL